MIPWFPSALFAVLDGLGGAIADAGHAVGAAAAPKGLAVWQGDVVQGTSFDALAAAIAGIAHRKGRILYNDGVEEGVHRAAQKTVEQMLWGGAKRLGLGDGGNGPVDLRLGLGDDLPRFLRLGRLEEGDVISR